jgi:hypothetical protein
LWLSGRLRRSQRQHLLVALFPTSRAQGAGIGERWLWQNDGIFLACEATDITRSEMVVDGGRTEL